MGMSLGPSQPKEESARKAVEGTLCRNRVCVSMKQLAKTVEEAKAPLLVDELFCGVLAELCEGKGLASMANHGRERTFVDGVRLFDEDVRMEYRMSGFSSGGSRSRLIDYDGVLSVV